jgi:uncharacterized membrane protein YeaQ/YmgE (transglycosylase-associated protein family)
VIVPAFLGGLFIGILSALPIINIANCCCLWITGGGALAGYLAQQEDPRPLTKARGALMGLAAGMIGAFVWLLTAALVDRVMAPIQERMLAELLANADDMPPQARQWLEMMRERGSAAFRLATGFAFQILAGFVFAPLGGLLAAVYFTKPLPPPPLPGDTAPPPQP